MSLNFLKHGPDNSRGDHYSALSGTFPNQHRFVIEKEGNDWKITEYHHTPGMGFEECGGFYAKTLKAAKAKCEEYLLVV